MNSLSNNSGQSLVQVIVAAAVSLIVMSAFISMQVNQAKENRALSEKLAALDFQRQLTQSFTDGNLCTNLLNGQQFDSTNAAPGSANPPSITLNSFSIPSGSAPGAPPLATTGQPVSPIATSPVVAANQPFRVVNIMGGSGVYTGSFQVNFDPKSLVRAIKPASAQIMIKTTSIGSSQKITACAGSSGGGGGVTIYGGCSYNQDPLHGFECGTWGNGCTFTTCTNGGTVNCPPPSRPVTVEYNNTTNSFLCIVP